jgi:hypothetical protein
MVPGGTGRLCLSGRIISAGARPAHAGPEVPVPR